MNANALLHSAKQAALRQFPGMSVTKVSCDCILVTLQDDKCEWCIEMYPLGDKWLTKTRYHRDKPPIGSSS